MSRGLGTNIFSLWYKRSILIELKNGARHLKEHPKISKFTKFDSYWFKPKGMVHSVWIGGTGVLQSILSSLILKVYHAFAFKPITNKFGKFTNFWMLFQMTCPISNSIDIEYSYQEKICSYPVPCSFRTWPTDLLPTYQGFIAQLVEQRTGITELMGSNLIVALKFFSG